MGTSVDKDPKRKSPRGSNDYVTEPINIQVSLKDTEILSQNHPTYKNP